MRSKRAAQNSELMETVRRIHQNIGDSADDKEDRSFNRAGQMLRTARVYETLGRYYYAGVFYAAFITQATTYIATYGVANITQVR